MRVSNMRRVTGFLSALALSWVFIDAAVTSELPAPGGSQAVKSAEVALKDGRVQEGMLALQHAAKKGDLKALLRIAEVFESGTLVAQDQLKACQIYSIAADHYSRVDRFDPGAALVATAFRRTAKCYAKGFAKPGWERNMRAVAELYFHAGVTLRDPESAFELARLYLSGEGIPQNTALAVEMLQNAARRHYPPAQALLGSMMWEGKVMKRRPAQGLALLVLGRERASPENRPWIAMLHDEAIIAAPKPVEREARGLVEKWNSVYGVDGDKTLVASRTALDNPSIPTPARSPTRELNGLDFDFISGMTESFENRTTRANVPLSTADEAAVK